MVETLILLVFSALLVGGIALSVPLYLILALGFLLFFGYGVSRGCKPTALLKMASEGLKQIGPVMVLFIIIGCLTAAWRASGTIAVITYYSSSIIKPESLIVISFILCSVMSFITGSSYAAAATTGVICMTIAVAMGANQVLVAGAVISGAFFGDRSSPLSATVNLVSNLTQTSVFDNVSRLIRTAVVPLVISALLYVILGLYWRTSGEIPNFYAMFSPTFKLDWICLLPTLVVIGMSLAKRSVNATMACSLAVALILCITIQSVPLASLPHILFFGYNTTNESIAHMVNGGGIISMVPIGCIVALASTYSGLFKGTGLLNSLQRRIESLARHTTPFTGVFATSVLTTAIGCDQILSIMLTKHLCDELEVGGEALALDLCNSSSIVAGFIPWSTVCVGVLAFLNAPASACSAAFFTYLVPLWILQLSLYLKLHPNFIHCPFARILGLREYDDRRLFDMPHQQKETKH